MTNTFEQNDPMAKLQDLVKSGLTKQHIELFFQGEQYADNLKRFKHVTAEMAAIYAKKNKDYGGSFDKSLNEDGLQVSKIRLGDKYYRFSRLINNPAEVADESIRDTLLDMANYAIMSVMWMDSKSEVSHALSMLSARDGIDRAIKMSAVTSLE